MNKSRIIVTEPGINFINYQSETGESFFGLKFIDLRNTNKINLQETLPSLMYNHLIIIDAQCGITEYLNVSEISFTQVYKQDGAYHKFSNDLGYYSARILLNKNEFDLVCWWNTLQKDNPYNCGWNSHADYVRKNNTKTIGEK